MSFLLLSFSPSEKSKSMKSVNYFLNKLFAKNFNRSDLVIGVGGGIVGDLSGFMSSVFKRGINYINLPTTLLYKLMLLLVEKQG